MLQITLSALYEILPLLIVVQHQKFYSDMHGVVYESILFAFFATDCDVNRDHLVFQFGRKVLEKVPPVHTYTT